MLWRNVRKQVRKDWYAVPAPHQEDAKDAMKWCREQTSIARFYTHYTNTRWWFESEKDAMMFNMRWSNSQSRRTKQMNDLNSLLRAATKATISTGPR